MTNEKTKNTVAKKPVRKVEAKTEKSPSKESGKPALASSGKFAVIKTGGKQYVVEVGRFYEFEKLVGEDGAKVIFDEVLLVAEGDKVDIGKPKLNTKVEGKILSQFKDKKVNVLKFKHRKRYKKAYGHRQELTKVEITKIG